MISRLNSTKGTQESYGAQPHQYKSEVQYVKISADLDSIYSLEELGDGLPDRPILIPKTEQENYISLAETILKIAPSDQERM